MKRRTPKLVLLFLLFFLAAGFSVAAFLEEDSQQTYSALDKAYYLSASDSVWIRPGLKVNILNVAIPADRKPVVTFKITDGSDQSLDREGKVTPGAVSLSFILAYLPQNADQYVDYSVRAASANGVTEQQAGTDSGGSYASLGDGTYTYTFKTVLPSNYDTTATHTLGIYATRNLRDFGLSLYMADVTRNFVPNGSPVTKVRDVVKTGDPGQSCNACHDPLMAHGETGRTAVEVCILCHTPQTKDPDTGNTVDMKVMVHKIHMGANLPSVKAGKPYQIIGHGVSDFSTVSFPMDIRNCTACHKGTTQELNYLLNPTRDACGSCHDDIDWKTGANHAAGPQANDNKCGTCHLPDGQGEYNAAVRDAHIPEYKSTQLVNPKVQVLGVTNGAPGQKPTVTFKITDKGNKILDPNKMARLSLTLAGPTSDYKTVITENPVGKTTVANGVGTYTFAAAVPSDAKGTFVIEAESYLNTTIQKLNGTMSVRDASDNVVYPFAVTGTVTPRRQVVDTANCNKCHDKLQLHGGNRNTVEACAVCHNPTATDAGSRPASALPTETIDFKILVHKIHTGEELTQDYTIYGHGGTSNNFNEVRYPGDRRDCAQCHKGASYTMPLVSGIGASTTPRNYWNPTMPGAAACLGCHDSVDAAAHALINTATLQGNQAESCSVCHKESAETAVSAIHAR